MLLLKHLHILPMAGPGPMNGDILLENGKIRALGRELSAPGAQVLELEGLYAMPGMVDAHCHIGMWEDGNMIEGDFLRKNEKNKKSCCLWINIHPEATAPF